MIVNKTQLKEDINIFLGDEGISYLQEMLDKNKFYFAWGSCLGGSVGMQVRNYLVDKYTSKIYEDLGGYNIFEDLITELTLEMLK